MSFHVEYQLPGYPSTQVERFATQAEAERRYDELAANVDVEALTQPFDAEVAAVPSQPAIASTSINISVTVEVPVVETAPDPDAP